MKINWQKPYFCEECKKLDNHININDLLPNIFWGNDGWGLEFYVKCPNCGKVSKFPQSSIPFDVAKELIDNYDQKKAMLKLQIWVLENKKSIIESKIKTLIMQYMDYIDLHEGKNHINSNKENYKHLLEQERDHFEKIK